MYSTKNRYEQGQALRKEIYMYIVSYIKLVGYAPSVTEISERVDAGRATVWKHISTACERCMNVLAYKYLNGADGYEEYSDEWKKCNTECDFCKIKEDTKC